MPCKVQYLHLQVDGIFAKISFRADADIATSCTESGKRRGKGNVLALGQTKH